MKYFFVLVFALLVGACDRTPQSVLVANTELVQAQTVTVNDSVNAAYENRASNVIVEGQGIVAKILADDNKGARHQKFLVKIASGKTLLFAHNIDLAPRVEDINIGDTVSFSGEYVYNPKGGVIHWTHRDPQGEKQGGWIKHKGNIYQ